MSVPDLLSAYASKCDRRKANFVICQSCFWCASCLKADYVFPMCVQCKSAAVDSLPIFDGEFYEVELLENGNVELMFGSA